MDGRTRRMEKINKTRTEGSSVGRQDKTEVANVFRCSPWKALKEAIAKKATNPLEDFENLDIYNEDSGSGSDSSTSDVEDGNLYTKAPSFELKSPSHYEEEDWEKELAENENSSNPYDFDDIVHCGGFLDEIPSPSFIQEVSSYDPSMHHVAPLIVKSLKAIPVEGQFDDAID